MEVTIRRATAHDYDELCEIIEEVDALHREHLPHLFRKPEGPARERDYILGLLSDQDVAWFVAEVEGPVPRGTEGRLAGFVHVVVRDTPPIPIVVPRRLAIVDNLAVREGFRRAGIGRALMDKAHRWARNKGATEVELNVYEFNESAIAFYRSLGYENQRRMMSKRLA